MQSEEINSIMVDIGSSQIRAGYCGEDLPKHVFNSTVFKLEDQMEIENDRSQKYYLSDNLNYNDRNNIKLVQLYKAGVYNDFDALENILQQIYFNELKIQPQEQPLLMSEPSIQNKQRNKLCELVFEKLNVLNFYVCKSAVLSCFSLGRSTAIVLDSGSSSTYAVPVHDGYALQKTSIKYDLGGDYVDNFLQKYILNDLQVNINMKKINSQNQEIKQFNYQNYFRDIKESLYKQEQNDMLLQKDILSYELPDGQKINMTEKRKNIYDVLLGQQSLKKSEFLSFKGYHQMVLDSVNNCDCDIKKDLFQNIIICGGNSNLGGLTDKIQKKITETAPQSLKVKFLTNSNGQERRFSSWIGGSILGCLGSFQNVWISKKEYEEHGNYIIQKKCP